MSKTKVCLFCGRGAPEVKISGEHVLRAKLKEHFGGLSKIEKNDRYLDFDGQVKERKLSIPKSPFDQTVNEVCKPCNEGWLNQEVEIPVEPLLVSLMYGQRSVVMQSDARLLALWAAKTAAMRALTDPGRRAIPPEHYRHMRDYREPPPGTYVWMAHVHPDWTAFSRHARFTAEQDGVRGNGHLTSLAFGHLSLFVAGFTGLDLDPPMLDEMVSNFDAHETLRLWPSPNASNWPGGIMDWTLARRLTNPIVPQPYLPYTEGSVELYKL